MDELKIRVLYQHRSGRIFYCIGTALDQNKATQVIISNVEDGVVHVRPINMFQGPNADYQLAMPNKG